MSWFGEKKEEGKPPPCFGESWHADAVECKGGVDPAYKEERLDPKSGEVYISHLREKCGYFDACGSRLTAKKMGQAQQLVPVTSLTRAWMQKPTPAPVSNPQPTGGTSQAIQQFTMQQMQQQFAQMQQQMMQQQMEAMRRGQLPAMMMPGMMPQGPMPGYQQMMPVNFEIPQYLTQREYRRPDEGVFKMLGREVFRSMLKSAGHTFANFWDSTPFYMAPPKE